MKGILGILIALCFVLSVTAATASAGAYDKEDRWSDDNGKNWNGFENKHKDEYKKDWKKGDYCKKYMKWVWIPGYFEKKVIKKVFYKHHQKIVIKKVIRIWIPGHWVLKFEPCKPTWH